jgi:hypothetical protein
LEIKIHDAPPGVTVYPVFELTSIMNYPLIISIYAAIVSTFVATWRVYEFVTERKGRIKVKLRVRKQALLFTNGAMGPEHLALELTIKNMGSKTRFIELPQLQIDIKQNGKYLYMHPQDFDKETKFPLALESGGTYQYAFNYGPIAIEMNNRGLTSVRAVVEDTHEKKYSSSWINI